LRRWGAEDLGVYARICDDANIMRYLPGTMTREQTEEQMTRFVRRWEE
jgi:hypothetical protein